MEYFVCRPCLGFYFNIIPYSNQFTSLQLLHWNQGHTHIQWELYTSLAYDRLFYWSKPSTKSQLFSQVLQNLYLERVTQPYTHWIEGVFWQAPALMVSTVLSHWHLWSVAAQLPLLPTRAASPACRHQENLWAVGSLTYLAACSGAGQLPSFPQRCGRKYFILPQLCQHFQSALAL